LCGLALCDQACTGKREYPSASVGSLLIWAVFPSFLVTMHEKRGDFCMFLLKIAEKEEKEEKKSRKRGETDLALEQQPFHVADLYHIYHYSCIYSLMYYL
jgi:hypothetical protein